MPIFGVDVSHHQGGQLDWEKIRASGIDFMFARASLAKDPDETYRKNVNQARAAGMPVTGAYHFLYPNTFRPAAEQARVFFDQIKNHIDDPKGLLTMLDVERDGKHTPHINAVRDFAAAFADLTHGHPLLLYAPGWYWGMIDNPDASDLGPLVASRYVSPDRGPKGHAKQMTPERAFSKIRRRWWRASHGGWSHATILQFTSFGKVDGRDGRIDLNAFRGSVDELRRLATPGAAPLAIPDDGPDDEPPDLDDDDPDEGSPRGAELEPFPHTKKFHRVVSGDTLSQIAIDAGFKAKGGKQPFEVMIEAFPENKGFRANPGKIDPGDRVRIR